MTREIVFLDIEASSLGGQSYPIEIGWAPMGETSESYLLAPAPGWTDWAAAAEAVHGISRAKLAAEGQALSVVAIRMMVRLVGPEIVLLSDQPAWDQIWLNRLMQAAGRSDHGLVLERAVSAYVAEARRLLQLAHKDDHRRIGDLMTTISDIIGDAEWAEGQRKRVRHRAGPDAEGHRWILERIRSEVDRRLAAGSN